MSYFQELCDLTARSFERQISILALQAFEEVVKPYLIENGLTLLVGNGTWYIFNEFEADETNREGKEYRGGVFPEDLPKKVREAIQADVSPFRCGELGQWMPDFHYPEYQANEENKP